MVINLSIPLVDIVAKIHRVLEAAVMKSDRRM
jgi:hypothetical protein